MKKVVLIAAWFFAAGAALAQPQNAQERARQSLEHQSLTLAEATQMIADAIDANHDHRISRAEWLAYWPAPTGKFASYDPARDFDGFDLNHDGFLDGAREAQPGVAKAVRTAQTDCDENVDNVFSGADELSCLYDYAMPHPRAGAGAPPAAPSAGAAPRPQTSAPSATTPSQTSAPRASGPRATLTIEVSLRAPGPGRVFTPLADVPVYLSSRDLEQTLAAAGLTRPSPLGAWLIACQAQARSAACQQGVTAVRGNDPAARGLTDAQGHFTFSSPPVGRYFVVAIGSLTPGHTFIWCVPIDIHAGDNELTLGGHNLYVDPAAPPR
jgi:hypothetical protein